MFTNPIVVYTTPFFSEKEEKLIISPEKVVGFGVDNHKNMFVNAVDGGRYYIADNCEKTALELTLYMYGNVKDFGNEKIREMFSGVVSGKE